LAANTTGHDNVAGGASALLSSTTASNNVAVGSGALHADVTGATNVAAGNNALRANTTAANGVAVGSGALAANTTGVDNVAFGTQALNQTMTGHDNTALGFRAGTNLTSGNNDVYLANKGNASESGQIRIGTAGTQTAAFMAGIDGVSIPGPTRTVLVNGFGQLGTATASSAALKTDVRPLAAGAGSVLGLRPVPGGLCGPRGGHAVRPHRRAGGPRVPGPGSARPGWQADRGLLRAAAGAAARPAPA